MRLGLSPLVVALLVSSCEGYGQEFIRNHRSARAMDTTLPKNQWIPSARELREFRYGIGEMEQLGLSGKVIPTQTAAPQLVGAPEASAELPASSKFARLREEGKAVIARREQMAAALPGEMITPAPETASIVPETASIVPETAPLLEKRYGQEFIRNHRSARAMDTTLPKNQWLPSPVEQDSFRFGDPHNGDVVAVGLP